MSDPRPPLQTESTGPSASDPDERVAALQEELARSRRELAEHATTVRRLRQEIRRASREIQAITQSRTYRLGRLFRDGFHDWRLALALPFRVAWFLVPFRAKQRIRFERDRLVRLALREPVRTVTNEPWPVDRPLVSVVIPCYNYGETVEDAIDSVLAQTIVDYEILVVDGGSDDGATRERLARLDRPRTRVILRDGGRHLVGDNRNHGIAQARGKYVCCLDADDILRPTYLEKAVYLLETGGVDVVFPSVQCFGESDLLWLVEDPTLSSCLAGNGVSTVGMFRRDAWEEVGGYRDWGLGEDHVPEDWDFWVRLLAAGRRLRSIREPLLWYRVHPQGLTGTARTTRAQQAEAIRAANEDVLGLEDIRRIRRRSRYPIRVRNPTVNLDRRPKPARHVVFAVPFTVVGGADTILLQIAARLREAGWELSVVTTVQPQESMGDNSARFEEITPEIYHLPRFLRGEDEMLAFLLHLLRSRSTEVLFIVGSAFVLRNLREIRRRFPGLRVVDQLFNEFGHLEENRRVSALIDHHVVASDALARLLVEEHGERPERISTILHGVDTEEEFAPDRISPDPALVHYPELRDRKVVTFVGRFSEEKAPHTFVDIAESLSALEDVSFLMIGDGPEFEEVKERVEGLGLEARLLLPRFVDDVRPYLRITDVLVIPSRIEGIPIVLLEAMSLGIPTVASRVGGIPSVFERAAVGHLCDPDDSGAFAQRVHELLVHPELRRSMGRSARDLARSHYSLRRMTGDYLRMFGRVAGTPDPTDGSPAGA